MQLNETKKHMDSVSGRLAMKRNGGKQDGTVDSEHYELLSQLKAHKAQYRLLFDSFKEMRGTLDSANYSVDEARQMLITEFDKWAIEQGSPQVKYLQVSAAHDSRTARRGEQGKAIGRRQSFVARLDACRVLSSVLHSWCSAPLRRVTSPGPTTMQLFCFRVARSPLPHLLTC